MFDTLTLAAIADEFATRLIHGRIQRVMQVGDAAIGLEIYAEHRRRVLLASAESQSPHLYLSAARVTADPDRVTPLLLLLRKYVRGGWITAVDQPRLERIVRVSIAKPFSRDKHGQDGAEAFEAADEDHSSPPGADLVYTHLIVELMGRRSNVILTDDTGRILDATKRVTPDMSRVRPVLPGRIYEPPPPQVKHDPRSLNVGDLASLLTEAAQGDEIADLLVRSLAGFSPQMAREAVYRALGESRRVASDLPPEEVAALWHGLGSILAPLDTGSWEPTVYSVDGRPIAFAAIRLEHLRVAEARRFDSISNAIESGLSATRAAAQPVGHVQRRSKLVDQISAARGRELARLRSLEEERERAEQADRWRRMGEWIYANIHQLRPGQAELDVDGLSIPLDPARSPSENAQRYFDRYRKAQSATANLPELIERARTDVAYLEQLATLASLAETFDEIEQLRREWEAYGGRPGAGATGRRREPAPKRPRPYRTTNGDLIYAGRNGRQNELVTFGIAGPDDAWLHARGIPGAHVIVHWAGPEDPRTLEQAASLAAYLSSGRSATSVDVDITRRRSIRKIKGAQPGMVTYRDERTLRVRPLSPRDLGLE